MESPLYEMGLYIFILGLIVQSIYRIFNPIIGLFYKNNKGEIEEEEEEEIQPSTNYFPGEHSFILPAKKKKKITWKDLIVPPILGLIIAWLFWPITIFDYLPFQPQFPIIAYIATSLVISRVANAEHDSFKTIGEFFMGIASRVFHH